MNDFTKLFSVLVVVFLFGLFGVFWLFGDSLGGFCLGFLLILVFCLVLFVVGLFVNMLPKFYRRW